MADYSFLSQTTNNTVESIIAEAIDHAVLEQVSSINLSGTSECILPSDLETRFTKLKSIPKPTNSQIEPIPISSPDQNFKPQTPENDLNPISPNGYFSSPSISSKSSVEPPSPKRKICCFWVSPVKKKSKERRISEFDWVNSDGVLSDLGTFSLKKQRRKLKKALKEQEKISREAEKVVEWAKQASARMEDFVIHDSLSSDEEKFK